MCSFNKKVLQIGCFVQKKVLGYQNHLEVLFEKSGTQKSIIPSNLKTLGILLKNDVSALGLVWLVQLSWRVSPPCPVPTIATYLNKVAVSYVSMDQILLVFSRVCNTKVLPYILFLHLVFHSYYTASLYTYLLKISVLHT